MFYFELWHNKSFEINICFKTNVTRKNGMHFLV